MRVARRLTRVAAPRAALRAPPRMAARSHQRCAPRKAANIKQQHQTWRRGGGVISVTAKRMGAC